MSRLEGKTAIVTGATPGMGGRSPGCSPGKAPPSPAAAAIPSGAPPSDRILDGYDQSAVLRGEGQSPREEMFFYRGRELFAARLGPWKAHLKTQSGYGGDAPVAHDPPLFCQRDEDPGERFDVAARHPEVLERIRRRAEAHQATVEPVPDQLAIRLTP